MPRQILHAHRGAWEAALEHPKAVVLDYEYRQILMFRRRMVVRSGPPFSFLAFMLRGADLIHARRAILQAVFGNHQAPDSNLTHLMAESMHFIAWMEMTLEIHYGRGMILHTTPRETVACLRTLDPLKPLPPHVRGHATDPNTPHGKLLLSRRGLTPTARRLASPAP